MGRLDPVHGVSLQGYAQIMAHMAGSTEGAALAAAGVDPRLWQEIAQTWNERMSRGGEVYRRYNRFVREALEALCPGGAHLSLNHYVQGAVSTQLGQPQDEIAASFGISPQAYLLAAYQWLEKTDQDPWLKTYLHLRMMKGIAERTGQAPKIPLQWIAGQIVRQRRCHHCGGTKVTPPRTAYIYCDYCGALFDYDINVVVDDPTALDPDDTEEALDEVTVPQLHAAFQAGDKDEYARITRWKTMVMTEVCPEVYSPRIRDPEYRQQMVDQVLVPWRIAVRFDPQHRDLSHQADPAAERALETLTHQDIMGALEAYRRVWLREADLLEQRGIFASHPDGVDRERFLYVNVSTFVRAWMGRLGRDAAEALIHAAGVGAEYVEAPQIPLSRITCGNCGQPQHMPERSSRRMCEGCGHMLEAGGRTLQCTECGAAVLLPGSAVSSRSIACGFCEAQLSL